VILPSELTKKYSVDGTRYYFLRFGPLTNDIDITLEKITEVYNADLANGLGNLVARIAKLAEIQNRPGQSIPSKFTLPSMEKGLKNFSFGQTLEDIWSNIRITDGIISEKKLWEETATKIELLDSVIGKILTIAYDLQPFLPETAKKILKQFSSPKIKSGVPLFPRI
jgi:methionyl-tRNA synthetase